MEPMVVCATGIVVYSGYLTMRDIIADLRQEGILVKVPVNKKREDLCAAGIPVNRARLRSSKTQIDDRRSVWLTPQWSTHSRG